ncbi:MAG: FecR domain-containing protein [Chitinophagaceae bacterium]|nr:FecR domain-containing protein [Chitinophagaceae bacterium]
MHSDLKYLMDKYLNNTLTAEENQRLKHLLQQREHLDSLGQMILADLRQRQPGEEEDEPVRSAILEKLETKMTLLEDSQIIPIRQTRKRTWGWLAAASILLLAAGTWFYFRHDTHQQPQLAAKPIPQKKISPGANKATLTLADGSEIQLDDSNKGNIATQGGIKVIKLDNGVLAYNGKNTTGESMYNTIRTPRGGQYEIVLPDGTHAWLNSASTLRFPTSFTGPRREVTLTGQGYFEVTKNKEHPFIVHTNLTDINVLGTSFDIMAYEDEPEINTTLVEGAVTVRHKSSEQTLKPGEQSHLDLTSQSMSIRKPDVEEVIAWKNGKFQFGRSDIKTIMRQIARWYDVEIQYNGDLSGLRLSGVLSRKGDVTELLDALQETGDVHFKTENNKIIVTPANPK